MQNAAFAARGLDWVYVALDVPPERLEEAVRGLDALGFAGANVTIPHKRGGGDGCDEADGAVGEHARLRAARRTRHTDAEILGR